MNLPKLSNATLLRLAKEEDNANISAGKRLLSRKPKSEATSSSAVRARRKKEKVAA